MYIFAIESSCDETAAAVVRDGRFVLSNAVASQISIHALYGGVVPEIASRAHTEAVCSVTERALREASLSLEEIDAIAVTNRPGLIGALLVGVNFAKGLAYSSGKPLVPVHHIRGHIAACYTAYNGVDAELLEPPFAALVMSGGHTSLVAVDGYTSFRSIGLTRDDAAGEAFDKVARLLGLPYPSGAKMDELAKSGKKHAVNFPQAHVKDHPYDFSFSGLKTAAINYLHHAEQTGEAVVKEDVAASFTDAICKAVTERLERLFSSENDFPSKKLVLAGGVSANSHIRASVGKLCKKHGVSLYLPPLSLCGDNAVMIGAQACFEAQNAKEPYAPLSLNAYATCDISR